MTRIYEWLKIRNKQTGYFLVGLIVVFGLYIYSHRPPENFPVGQVVSIESGESLEEISNTLYEASIVRFPLVFKIHVILLGGEKRVIAGDYLLDRAASPADLAHALVRGDFKVEFAKITVPEGWTIFQIGNEIQKHLPNFDKNQFLSLSKGSEGYFFPETYFISSSTRPQTVIDNMRQMFEQKVLSLSRIRLSKRTLHEIITMASIIEGEAKTPESRRIISGILWKRLDIGMPLQVDVTFMYINGKNTYELTAKDLKIDSPYNTYVYKGLPPGPIGNPGLDSILAALEPTASEYLYYLSERDGTMHYAKTFEEHKVNRVKYL